MSNNHHYYRPFLYILSLFGFLFSLVYFLKYEAFIAGSIMVSGPVTGIIYSTIFKRKFYTMVTANILLSIMLYTIGGASLFTGAHTSTAIWWLITIPLSAGVFLSIKKSFLWLFLCLITVLIQYVLVTMTNYIPNEFLNVDTSNNKLLSLVALICATSLLTSIHLSISNKLSEENQRVQKKIEKERVNNAFNQGLIESTQSTLHTIGNTLTIIKSSLDLQAKSQLIKNTLKVCHQFQSKKNIEVQKNIDFVKYINNSLDKINTELREQNIKNNKRIDDVIETINILSNTSTQTTKENIRLSLLINDIIDEFQTEFSSLKINVIKDIENNIFLYQEPQRLEKAIKSSILNSISSLQDRKNSEKDFFSPELLISTKVSSENYQLVLSYNVTISKETEQSIFSPTSNIQREKSGKNLHNTANYIKSIGGNISLIAKEKEGAQLQISFPR